MANELKGGLHMPVLKWRGISFRPPRSFNGDRVDLLVGVYSRNPDTAKAFVGCPKGNHAVLSRACDTKRAANTEMRRKMKKLRKSWHPGPLDCIWQLPDYSA
ncbi:MAG: hypothetical protein HYS60_00585 [Candidatus Wildermuthbacteria bacterium]|nr:hypothetical protein [Candidatus Wildermuthbacteria bacterium]